MNRTMLRVETRDGREGYRVRYDAASDCQVTWWAATERVGLHAGDAVVRLTVYGRYGTDDAVSLTGAEAERLLAALTALMAERMDMQTMARGRGGRDGD